MHFSIFESFTQLILGYIEIICQENTINALQRLHYICLYERQREIEKTVLSLDLIGVSFTQFELCFPVCTMLDLDLQCKLY